MGTAPKLGFNMARMVGSAACNGGMNEYTIATGYGTALAAGDPVQFSAGTLVQNANDAGAVGVLQSIRYTDASGVIHDGAYWPASTTATNITALVLDNPLQTYHVKADGPVPLVVPGQLYAMNLTAPSAALQRSQMTMNSIPTITGDVDLSAVTTIVGTVSGSANTDAFTIKTTAGEAATTITIATSTTMTQFLAALNAVPNISASVAAGTGFLQIQSTNGYLITTVETVGNPITDFFAVTAHTAAGTKVTAQAASMVKVVSVPDPANYVVEVVLTLPQILADS